MKIEELTQFTPEAFLQIVQLMQQLSSRCVFTEAYLHATIDDPNSHLFVLTHEQRIIGCATLCLFHSPTGTKASVEDVVVASDYRGQHLGRELMAHLMSQARQYAPIDLHLTSKPTRIAANNLYQSLGFQRKETNVYRFHID